MGFSAAKGVASNAPGIEGILVKTTSRYSRIGKSTDLAGEGALGVSPPGVEGNGDNADSLLVLGRVAAGVEVRECSSDCVSLTRDRVLGREDIVDFLMDVLCSVLMMVGFLDRGPRVGQTWVEGSKKECVRV